MPELRFAFPGVVWLAALALVLITAPPVLARATLDDGTPARWEPGMVLVKLRPGVTPSDQREMLHRLGLREMEQLPLVPDLFEMRIPTGTGVPGEEHTLSTQPEVLYTQPDYIEAQTPDAGPSSPSYWPTDPFFWPRPFTPPQRCEEPDFSGQWPLWPLGHNLTDSNDPANKFNPLVSGRADVNGGLSQYQQYHSINVLPVWNLLREQGRLTGHGAWTSDDIREYGIAVQDTGLSNEPDIASQIAAVFSTVYSTEPDGTYNRIREVYRDNRNRNDLALIDAEFKQPKPASDVKITAPDRGLFALDDPNVLSPDKESKLSLPTGCDGHGTAVAAVADATANNGMGIAGVAYDAPLIGLRPGEPWDSPGMATVATDQTIDAARQAADDWWKNDAAYDTANIISQLAIVKALRVPILNMSYSKDLFEERKKPPIVTDPVLFEALLRTLATGRILGVTTAGNEGEQYGSRGSAPGTGKHAPAAPCGLKLLRNSDARIGSASGPTFSSDAFPGPVTRGNVDWADVNLLCTAATTSYSSRLWTLSDGRGSGRGDAAVDLAAPGQDITTLAREVVRNGTASSAIWVTSGTSFAAPMVAGAAALLREAAPGAPMSEIARALRDGARRNSFLDGLVHYGSLDVACALSELLSRPKPDWNGVRLDDPNFAAATRDCHGKTRYVAESDQTRDVDSLREKGKTKLSALIQAQNLSPAPSTSINWQETLLGRPEAERVAFTSVGTDVAPAKVKDLVYDAGTASVGCIPGFGITAMRIVVDDGAASAWFFPTDREAQRDRIEVALALGSPLPKSGTSVTIRVRAYCDQFPVTPG